jgi:NNP family nitrate/nitrite transporter-like MFS transporter
MNLFARTLGGMWSDRMFASFGFRGRIWAQFFALLFEGVFLFIFGCVTHDYEWYHALGVLVLFSICVQMAEGTSYGIVPFIKREQLAMVSALVGAGGNAGAVFAGLAFYKQDWEDALTPFKLHALGVIAMAILTPLFYWPEYGGMFSPPVLGQADVIREAKSVPQYSDSSSSNPDGSETEGTLEPIFPTGSECSQSSVISP